MDDFIVIEEISGDESSDVVKKQTPKPKPNDAINRGDETPWGCENLNPQPDSEDSDDTVVVLNDDDNTDYYSLNSDDDDDDVHVIINPKLDEWVTIKGTVSTALKVKVDSRYVRVSKRNSQEEPKRLKMPRNVAEKLISRVGRVKRELSKLKKKYRKRNRAGLIKGFTLSKHPWFKIAYSKLNSYWYVDVRKFTSPRGDVYQRDNGVCFAAEDAMKLITHINAFVDIPIAG
ncbi:uncharacterized protein LOC124289632 [Haliotis rubra]|uniref:uncharacterized protein LOC124289632 n=1 Tax=Haliotis rubra TaxID=36100 RepID=UPI001EE56AB5|nr:uncharacterized protein LOC124289632 [Haliotis rubra]